MGNTKKSKLFLGCLAAILLGAIGSGLWNVALGPVLSWTGNALLTAASFGVESVKNGVYREIAKGFHEQAGVTWLKIFSAFLMAIPFVFLFFTFLHRPVFAAIQKSVRGSADSPPRPKRMLVVLCLLLLFCCSFFFIQYLYVAYSNRAITHFRQSLSICMPRLDQQQEEDVLAKFAKIQCKNDYTAIMEELTEVANAASDELPDFKAW